LTKARSVIEQADKGNAQRYAAADLQRAHDELSSAERAANDRKNDDARRFAEKAEVDADLATARGTAARLSVLRRKSARASTLCGRSPNVRRTTRARTIPARTGCDAPTP